jgi:hypothetical protein
MSFPPGTEMFQFPGFASCTYGFSAGSPCGGVSPFGHPRINDRSHLPAAFRSVPRPSSPLGAKASTERPYHAREPFQHRPRAGPNRAWPSLTTARLAVYSVGAGTTHASANLHTHSDKPSHPTAAPPEGNPAARADNSSARSDSPSQRTCPAKASRPRRETCEGSREPTQQQSALHMEASGFEPLTPCLQSRCSTS